MRVVIIDYGVGNIQSIKFAFERLGVTAVLSNNVQDMATADRIIFPGVGEASTAMKKLRASGLDKWIPTLKQPVLGICLGMQLLCGHSEEGNTNGLGIFDVNVVRFTNKLKVPQMGWNKIENLKSKLFLGLEEDYVYLVHSFYAPVSKDTIATSEYGLRYSAALGKKNFFGVQFHPEKSGKYGEQILKNFLELKM